MDLLQNGTYACGTFRRGRVGIPNEVTEVRLKNQGEHLMMQRDNLVATAWQDKRTVFILSTNSDPTVGGTLERRKKSGAVVEVPCPQSVKNYTQYMNGVDHHDQLRSVYGISRKAQKWWMYVFFFLCDVAICNSYIIMCESPHHVLKSRTDRVRPRTQLEYRMALAHLLLNEFNTKRKLMQPQVMGVAFTHWPISGKKARCKMCLKNKQRHESRVFCQQCKVALCVDCFRPYHLQTFPDMFNQ